MVVADDFLNATGRRPERDRATNTTTTATSSTTRASATRRRRATSGDGRRMTGRPLTRTARPATNTYHSAIESQQLSSETGSERPAGPSRSPLPAIDSPSSPPSACSPPGAPAGRCRAHQHTCRPQRRDADRDAHGGRRGRAAHLRPGRRYRRRRDHTHLRDRLTTDGSSGQPRSPPEVHPQAGR